MAEFSLEVTVILFTVIDEQSIVNGLTGVES
jgi:hypothetical protein